MLSGILKCVTFVIRPFHKTELFQMFHAFHIETHTIVRHAAQIEYEFGAIVLVHFKWACFE